MVIIHKITQEHLFRFGSLAAPKKFQKGCVVGVVVGGAEILQRASAELIREDDTTDAVFEYMMFCSITSC